MFFDEASADSLMGGFFTDDLCLPFAADEEGAVVESDEESAVFGIVGVEIAEEEARGFKVEIGVRH